MIKTHTSVNGEQVRCTATVRGCPLGGEDEHMHFDNLGQVEEYNQLELAKKHGSQAGDFSRRDENRLKVLSATSDANKARERIKEITEELGEHNQGAGLSDSEMLAKERDALREELRAANGVIHGMEDEEITPLSELLEIFSHWDGDYDEFWYGPNNAYYDAMELHFEIEELWEHNL